MIALPAESCPRAHISQPGRLRSVWEMIEFNLSSLASAVHQLAGSVQSIEILGNDPSRIDPQFLIQVLGYAAVSAEAIVPLAKAADLDATEAAAQRLAAKLRKLRDHHESMGALPFSVISLRDVKEEGSHILTVAIDQLSKRFALVLSSRERDLYEATEPLFGDAVFNRFQGANDDIAEAGKCLALERGTATVFHLMRVLEAGLKALGKELGIPYAPSWEAYIKQLDKLLDGKSYDSLTSEQKAKRPFYQDVLGDLISIKSAWRNPTMHIVRSYGIRQAGIIFEASKGLMQHLAKELQGDPSAYITTGQVA